jgi:AcrR family transcriptional regulator
VAYAQGVPKLWSATIEDHRREVRVAILETTAELVSQRGALSVTMSEIAQATGIGRATLYKYFSDVESILLAWHERLIGGHLARLDALADGSGPAIDRLSAVLEGYAFIAQQRAGSQLAALLHRDEHVVRAEAGLVELLARLVREAALEGAVRGDVGPDELGSFCVHALNAAGAARSKAAVRRVVDLTLAALRP